MTGAPPPCAGEHVLFDSVDPCDHAVARQLCDTCPLADACRDRLAQVLATADYYGQPEGTWAGQLLADLNGRNRRKRRLAAEPQAERIHAEDAAYSKRDARQAHAAYGAGDTSDWAAIGNRVYGRRLKRAQRLAVAS